MNPRRFLPALFVLFIGSGCAALIDEIVWFQLLQLVIGSSAISLGILLGTFMGGMCIGSLLLWRVVSARQHPLRVYAALELGIGLAAVLILFGMPLLNSLYVTVSGGAGITGILFRGLAAAIILLPIKSLVQAMLASQTLNGVLLPVILIVMLRLINDPRLMGRFVNGRLFNIIAWVMVALLIGLTGILVVTSVWPGALG